MASWGGVAQEIYGTRRRQRVEREIATSHQSWPLQSGHFAETDRRTNQEIAQFSPSLKRKKKEMCVCYMQARFFFVVVHTQLFTSFNFSASKIQN